jgi:hypothetical protein
MHVNVTAAAIQSGWLGIDRGDWLSALTNFIAIIVGLLIASRVAPKVQERAARRDQRERLLRVLISTSPMPANPEYQGAIGLIPIDFKGNKRILDARAAYLDAVNEPTPSDSNAIATYYQAQVDKQHELIATIAQELDFDLTTEALRTGAYVSKGFVDREQLQLMALQSWPRIADALELNNRLFAHSFDIAAERQPESGEKG